jgi:hypothetical protein
MVSINKRVGARSPSRATLNPLRHMRTATAMELNFELGTTSMRESNALAVTSCDSLTLIGIVAGYLTSGISGLPPLTAKSSLANCTNSGATTTAHQPVWLENSRYQLTLCRPRSPSSRRAEDAKFANLQVVFIRSIAALRARSRTRSPRDEPVA